MTLSAKNKKKAQINITANTSKTDHNKGFSLTVYSFKNIHLNKREKTNDNYV